MLLKLTLMQIADPNTDTTNDDFRQDLEIKVTRVNIEAHTKK